MRPSFLIRQAEPADIAGVYALARLLDSYNLPADRRRLRKLLRDSSRSFRGAAAKADEKYLFVLEDLAHGRLAGCSMIVAKHGTPGLPHIYMTSFLERRSSRTLRRTVDHHCLRLGFTEDGPTEVGGLVVLPAYRGRPEKLGHWLSYVRFLYIAAHPERFQKNLLAEFLPVFLRKGRSPFWEYFGRKFTGLSYPAADRLSIDNKEFILSLFPRSTVYQAFFPPEVVKHLGRVGNPTRPAARILTKIGFRYLHQIEPFDGGPYFGALTRSVTLVRQAKQLQCRLAPPAADGDPHLLLAEGPRGVRALVSPVRTQGVWADVPTAAAAALRLADKDWFWAAPFHP